MVGGNERPIVAVGDRIIGANNPSFIVAEIGINHNGDFGIACEAIAAAADVRWPSNGQPHSVDRLLWTPPVPPWELARQADLARNPGIDFLFDITRWRDRKVAALRAHRTQHLAINRLWFDQRDVKRLLSFEAYRQAWGPALPEVPMSQLPLIEYESCE